MEENVCKKFRIDILTASQLTAIKAICQGTDVFVGTKTGSGKSLIYECIPVVFPKSAVIVIAPLVAIMKEQTERLVNLRFKATYIGKDADEDNDIIDGQFDFVFGSPEAIVGDDKWKSMLQNYKDRLKLIVVDEAHTVIQW